MKKYSKIFISALMLLVFTGCEDFLDINDDPNNPLDVPVTQLLPTVQERFASAVGMSSLSGTASFLVQHNVTRGDLNDYIIAANTGSGAFNSLYIDCLTDIREILRISDANGYTAYAGVAKIMKAHIYSVLVDYWGDIPFTEAGFGSANPTPAFDEDAEIYDEIFALIDEGLADLNEPVTFLIRGDDLIYGGDLEKWEMYANTLKLKLYNQIRLVRDVSAEVNDLLDNEPLISDLASDFEFDYGASVLPDNRNPAYPGQYAPASKTSPNPYFYEVMSNQNTFLHNGNLFDVTDPRIRYYFYNQLVPAETSQNHPPAYWDSGTGFASLYSFSFNIDPREGFDQSVSATAMGLYPIGGRYDVGDGATANNNGYGRTPQRILTFFARKFIEAELALAGVTTADERALLEEAVEASFAKVNEVAAAASAPLISDVARDAYVTEVLAVYDAAASDAERLQIIMTQKWIASYGYAVDVFTDFRRTGWPLLHDGNTDNRATTVRTRELVVSFVYPDNEILLNPNAPSQRNPYLSKVFWDN